MLMSRLIMAVFSISGLFFLSEPVSASDPEVHDVKYFFDNVGPFRDNMPRSGIATENITVRGKLLVLTVRRKCKNPPCVPKKTFVLQDVKNKRYALQIMETTPFLLELKANRIYTLSGILEKSVDFRRRKVSIFNFKPEKMVGKK
jgi:hypothetical protein